jgi:hypothetical protein
LNEVNRDRRSGDKQADLDGAYNEVWFDRGTKVSRTKRTSLIVDPPDGRVPPMKPEAQAKYERIQAKLAQHGSDSAEDRPTRPLPDVLASGTSHVARQLQRQLSDCAIPESRNDSRGMGGISA